MTHDPSAAAGRAGAQRRRTTSHPQHRGTIARKRFKRLKPFAVLLAALAMVRCDFLDPRSVTNPNVTEEGFLRTPNAAANWTRGVERQLAVTMNELVMGSEVVSDNVFNNRTLFSKVFDIPQIDATDFDVTHIQRAVHRLREMADEGLTRVAAADPSTSNETRARLHFHRGMAHLFAAEFFVGLPGEAGGPVLEPTVHLAKAVEDFDRVGRLSTDADTRAAALLAIARAHHRAGKLSEAVAAAAEVRAAAPNLLRTVQFDVTAGPTNQMQFAIYDSGQNEFQPLPRLDFLFPKYFSTSATDQKPIPVLKGEEAFLILAEARIAQGNLAEARTLLEELVDRVAARPTALVNDRGQARGRRGGTWIYPNSASLRVSASPQDEPRAGLVLTRSGDPVRVPLVSGTSVTREMLAGATSATQLLELLYLMRQEIFVLEARRMVDLGIRFPVALEEAQVNPKVGTSSPALTARIPSFIPRDLGLDRFAYRDGDTLAVIRFNMNRVLVENRTSNAVLPFH